MGTRTHFKQAPALPALSCSPFIWKPRLGLCSPSTPCQHNGRCHLPAAETEKPRWQGDGAEPRLLNRRWVGSSRARSGVPEGPGLSLKGWSSCPVLPPALRCGPAGRTCIRVLPSDTNGVLSSARKMQPTKKSPSSPRKCCGQTERREHASSFSCVLTACSAAASRRLPLPPLDLALPEGKLHEHESCAGVMQVAPWKLPEIKTCSAGGSWFMAQGHGSQSYTRSPSGRRNGAELSWLPANPGMQHRCIESHMGGAGKQHTTH